MKNRIAVGDKKGTVALIDISTGRILLHKSVADEVESPVTWFAFDDKAIVHKYVSSSSSLPNSTFPFPFSFSFFFSFPSLLFLLPLPYPTILPFSLLLFLFLLFSFSSLLFLTQQYFPFPILLLFLIPSLPKSTSPFISPLHSPLPLFSFLPLSPRDHDDEKGRERVAPEYYNNNNIIIIQNQKN